MGCVWNVVSRKHCRACEIRPYEHVSNAPSRLQPFKCRLMLIDVHKMPYQQQKGREHLHPKSPHAEEVVAATLAAVR